MRKNFRIGPGAASLMLVVVVVALSLLALLSLIEAYGNHKLTVRSIDFAEAEYNASANAQYTVAELDAILAESRKTSVNDTEYFANITDNLPENMTMINNIVTWEEPTPNGRVLKCSVRINSIDSDVRFSWQEHMFEGVSDQF